MSQSPPVVSDAREERVSTGQPSPGPGQTARPRASAGELCVLAALLVFKLVRIAAAAGAPVSA
jgi:hypothetical protein